MTSRLDIPAARNFPPKSISHSGTERSVLGFHRIDDLPDDARALMRDAAQKNVELGLDWFENLVATVFPDEPSIRFYVLRREDRVRAVLPIRAERRRGGTAVRALSNFYTALYEPALAHDAEAADLAAVLRTIRHEVPSVGSTCFSPMDPASKAYRLLREACRLDGWRAYEFFCFGNWFMTVTQSWPDYFKGRAGEVRNTIKRMSKKLTEAGGTLEIVSRLAELPAALEAYAKVYAASWKVEEPFDDFIPGLLRTYAARGWLRLGIVRIQGEAVAAQIWIVANGRAEIYKLAYDENYKRYSPGTLLTNRMMGQVFADGDVSEIDYLIGDDPYKKAWMEERRERWGIVAYNPRTLSGVTGFLREAAARHAKLLLRRESATKWRQLDELFQPRF